MHALQPMWTVGRNEYYFGTQVFKRVSVHVRYFIPVITLKYGVPADIVFQSLAKVQCQKARTGRVFFTDPLLGDYCLEGHRKGLDKLFEKAFQ